MQALLSLALTPVLVKQLFNDYFLRVEEKGPHVIVVDCWPCVTINWAEIVNSLVFEGIILLVWACREGREMCQENTVISKKKTFRLTKLHSDDSSFGFVGTQVPRRVPTRKTIRVVTMTMSTASATLRWDRERDHQEELIVQLYTELENIPCV